MVVLSKSLLNLKLWKQLFLPPKLNLSPIIPPTRNLIKILQNQRNIKVTGSQNNNNSTYIEFPVVNNKTNWIRHETETKPSSIKFLMIQSTQHNTLQSKTHFILIYELNPLVIFMEYWNITKQFWLVMLQAKS